jgi:uncharacterized repeat protein (TIGR03803 family)
MKTLKWLAVAVVLLTCQTGRVSGQTLTNLYSFTGDSDGGYPGSGLVEGSDGNFYGTMKWGFGMVIRFSPSGSFTNLHTFSLSDGDFPCGWLVQGSDGYFYGTTDQGGPSRNGNVFRISSSGSFTNLYFFTGGGDGSSPEGGLVQGGDGNFYGTTLIGGNTKLNYGMGYGTVFRISPSGNFTNLYSFTGGSDGGLPYTGLAQGRDGNFYGTTLVGGNTNLNGGDGAGTIFRIGPSGNLATLYRFTDGSDGSEPETGLVQGSDGNFYGTTPYGGTSTNCGNGGCGNVFRISPDGSFTNLYSFTGDLSNGRNPHAELVQASDGNFYGTTDGGGASGNGTVFRISPNGNCTILHSFSIGPDSGEPGAGLVQGSDGNFYGLTYNGGSSNKGTFFRFSVPLNPPANQISAIQLSNLDIVLYVPSVAGETYQLQFSDSPTNGCWSNVDGASVTNSIGALLTLTNFGGASVPQRFYRFSITP